MADIVSINKIIDDNYISHDGTRLSEKLKDTGWVLLDSTYGDVYYRKIGNLLFIHGTVIPAGNTITITLPVTINNSYIFIVGGSSLYYTKVWTGQGSNILNISAGNGTNTSYYSLDLVFLTD